MSDSEESRFGAIANLWILDGAVAGVPTFDQRMLAALVREELDECIRRTQD